MKYAYVNMKITWQGQLMMFSEIEARRETWAISQIELCRRAGVHPTTYTARKNGRAELRESTLARLNAALDELISERKCKIMEVEAR